MGLLKEASASETTSVGLEDVEGFLKAHTEGKAEVKRIPTHCYSVGLEDVEGFLKANTERYRGRG